MREKRRDEGTIAALGSLARSEWVDPPTPNPSVGLLHPRHPSAWHLRALLGTPWASTPVAGVRLGRVSFSASMSKRKEASAPASPKQGDGILEQIEAHERAIKENMKKLNDLSIILDWCDHVRPRPMHTRTETAGPTGRGDGWDPVLGF